MNCNAGKDDGTLSGGLSTGIDMVSVYRIELAAEKDRFLKKVFTEGELACCDPKRNGARRLAERFAAKEACLKALGTGLTSGLRWKDIEVVDGPDGKPGLRLHGRAAEILGTRNIHLSLSCVGGLATAFVVIG
jgi:holo-[acyl-carrier protein] synthase